MATTTEKNTVNGQGGILDPKLADSPNRESWLHFYEHPRGEVLHLDHIRVAKDAPTGTGTAFMEQLCEIADAKGLVITITPSIFESKNRKWKTSTSYNRLKRFYGRFGFRRNATKGRFDLRGTMHRNPKTNPEK